MEPTFSPARRQQRAGASVALSLGLHLTALVGSTFLVHPVAPTAPVKAGRQITFLAFATPAPRMVLRRVPTAPSGEASRPLSARPTAPVPESPVAPHDTPVIEAPAPIEARNPVTETASAVPPTPSPWDRPPVEARATAHIQPTVGAFDARRDGSSRQRAGESAVAVRLAGFTPSATRTLARAERADELRPGGFDRRAAPPPPPSSAPAPHDPIDIPVEITFKPSPEYTEAARALKIEGVVRLEVDFLASGEVRVVRVVDGLGHGLDEAAARAARQIRFRPARAGGVAVDLRTTLQITFRIL